MVGNKNIRTKIENVTCRAKVMTDGSIQEGYLVNSRGNCSELPPIYWICQNRYDNGTVFNERSCDDTFIWYIIAEEDYSTIERFIGNAIDGKEIWTSVLWEGEQ